MEKIEKSAYEFVYPAKKHLTQLGNARLQDTLEKRLFDQFDRQKSETAPNIRNQNPTSIIQRFLLVVACLASFVTSNLPSYNYPNTLVPVSVNTDSTHPTFMDRPPQFACAAYQFSGTDQLFYTSSYNSYTETYGGLRVFKLDGTFAAGLTIEPSGSPSYWSTINTMALKDPLKIYLAEEGDNHVGTMSLQYSSGAYSLSQVGYGNLPGGDSSRGMSDPSSNYVYYISYSQNIAGRVDITTFAGSQSSNNNELVDSVGMELHSAGYIIHMQRNSNYYMGVRMSDLTVQFAISMTSMKAGQLLADNLNENIVYIANTNAGGNQVTLTIETMFSSLISNANLPNPSNIYNLINLGPYQYLGLESQTPGINDLYLYDKTSLTNSASGAVAAFIYSTTDRQHQNSNIQFCVMSGFRSGVLDRLYYALFDTKSSNFQTYYLKMGHCMTRNANWTCDVCDAGYYRDSYAANNSCLATSDFPAANGVDSADQLMLPCSDTQCSACLNNYQVCTACNTGAGYYLDTTTNTCLYAPSLPNGFGPNLANGQTASCTDAHCLDCRTSILVCTTCDLVNKYYRDPVANNCVYVTSISGGKGGNDTTGIFELCWPSNCHSCQANSDVCTACNTASFYYLNDSSGLCILSSSLTSGFGADTVNGDIKPCTDVNCINCQNNYQVCTQCNTASFFYLNTTSHTCILNTNIITGYGANTVSGNIQLCSDNHCVNCQLTYTQCTACNTGLGYYLITSTHTCVYISSISNYNGANLVTGTVDPCFDPNCKVCYLNCSTCQHCDQPNNYYQNASNLASCVLITSIPPGMGANSSTGFFENCWPTNCPDCQSNSLQCTTCDVANNYYLNTSTHYCVLNSSIIDFYGPDIITGQVEPCADPHCQLCKADITQCDWCDVTHGYFFNQSSMTCVYETTIAQSFGGDLTTGIVVSCNDLNCLACQNDYTICTACDTGEGYYLNTTSSTCLHTSLMPSQYGANTATGTVAPCSDSHCLTCNLDITVCTTCDLANKYYLDPAANNCEYVTSIPAGSGGNDTTGIFELCWPSNCNLCQANSDICTACNTASFYYLNDTDGTCISRSSLISGFGADTVVGDIKPCLDTHCTACQNNYKVCTQCDTANFFYLNSTSHTCILNTNIITGYGADLITGDIDPCSDTNCLNCQINYLQCSTCNNVTGYYLDIPSKTCILNTNIIDFYGADTVTGNIDSCQTTNCRKCQLNYTTCTYCDTSSTYYMLNSTKQCLYFSDIADTYGPDLTTGIIVPCNDPNCFYCKTDNMVCSVCDMANGYFLNSTIQGCVTIPQISAGYGADYVGGGLLPCSVVGCLDCKLNYTQCGTCDQANNYYLNTNDSTCTLIGNIPNNYGADLIDGIVEPCLDSACLICNLNNSACQACDFANGNYLDPAYNTCLPVNLIPDGEGADNITGTVMSCSVPQCLTCQKDYTTCTSCNTSSGLYLNVSANNCTSIFPVGYGPDLTSGIISPCSDPNCINCTLDIGVCEMCNVNKLYYLDGAGCTPASKAPAGSGIDLTTSFLQNCFVEFCSDCRFDYNFCSSCYEDMGYYLEGNICVLMDAKMIIRTSTNAPASVDDEFVVTTTPSVDVNQTTLYSMLKTNVVWQIVFIPTSTKKPEQGVKYNSNPTSSDQGILMDITLTTVLQEKTYKINVTCNQKYYNVTINQTLYRISAFVGLFDYTAKTSVAEIKGAQATGAAMSNAMGGSISSSPAFLPIMMAVVALDPTGVLMKFNQILKIINKLYFININYGIRLTAFLAEMGKMSQTETDKNPNMKVYNANNYRGKLTQSGMNIDFVAAASYKLYMYLISWFFWLTNYFLMKLTKVPKWYLYAMYYGLRIHLIIFNLVFIDFIWQGAHTMLHSRGLDPINLGLTLIAVLLVTLDLMLILEQVSSDRDWLYWIHLKKKIAEVAEEEKKKMHFEELREKRKKRKENLKNGIKDNNSKDEKKDEKKTVANGDDKKNDKKKQEDEDDFDDDEDKIKKPQTDGNKPVSYQRTYEEIQSNYHQFKMMSVNLSVLARVYLNPIARSIYFNHAIRSTVYQSVIVAGQYTSGGVIAVLLAMELAKISYSIYFYAKYKYLKNIICLLMEVMQSLFLFLFLLIAMILHPKGFDEIILDFYQDAGIWIVIASCVAEYLLLLTYIGVAAYDFFKNRKAINRALDRMKYSFIKYGNDPLDKHQQMEAAGVLSNTAIMPAGSSLMNKESRVFNKNDDYSHVNIINPMEKDGRKVILNNEPMNTRNASKNKEWVQHVKQKLQRKSINISDHNNNGELSNRNSTKEASQKNSSPLKSSLVRLKNQFNLKKQGLPQPNINRSVNLPQYQKVLTTPPVQETLPKDSFPQQLANSNLPRLIREKSGAKGLQSIVSKLKLNKKGS